MIWRRNNLGKKKNRGRRKINADMKNGETRVPCGFFSMSDYYYLQLEF